MPARTFESSADFLDAAGPWLGRRMAENNLLLGVATRDRVEPGYYCDDPWFVLVEQADRPVLAALRTPPRPMLIGRGDLAAVPALVEAARRDQPDNPGVIGPVEEAEAFAAAWGATDLRVDTNMRAYELTAVEPDPRRPAGRLRPVTEAERPLLADWITGFRRDAHLTDTTPAEETARRMVARERVHFYEVDGAPVTSVAGSPDLPGAARIGMVFTPPSLRGNGFASAATAALSALLLADVQRLFPFTDLANTTSNSIYQRVGYRPVCDYVELAFGKKESS